MASTNADPKQAVNAMRKLGLYQSAELRMITQRVNGEHLLVLAKVQFRGEPPTIPLTYEVAMDEPDLVVWHGEIPIRQAENLVKWTVADVPRGTEGVRLSIPATKLATGIRVVMSTDAANILSPLEILTSRQAQRDWGCPHGALVVARRTGDLTDKLRMDDAHLRRNGLRSKDQFLYRQVANPRGPTVTNPSVRPTNGVIAVLPFLHAQMAEATIQGSTVTVRVVLGRNQKPGDYSVILHPVDYKGSLYGPERSPEILRPLKSATVSHTFDQPIRSVRAELYWDAMKKALPDAIGEIDATSMPVTSLSNEIFAAMPGLGQFVKDRLTTEKDSKGFEWATATLLSQLGFQVVWRGFLGGKLEGEIDIIAWDEKRRWVLIGECSLQPGDTGGKIDLLAERGASFKELNDASVKRVLFTTYSSEALDAHRAEPAQKAGVILATRDVIERLEQTAARGEPLEAAWGVLERGWAFGVQRAGSRFGR